MDLALQEPKKSAILPAQPKSSILSGQRALLLAPILVLALMLPACIGGGQTQQTGSPSGSGASGSPVISPPGACTTKECFISSANDCGTASLTASEDFGSVSYSSSNCSFTKTILQLDSGEPADMKTALEGKSLTCKYSKGNFDSNWTSSLVLGISSCEGPLADALGQMVAFASD